MTNNQAIVEIYKKELEVFLATLDIYKGNVPINNDEKLNAENKEWMKKQFIRIKGGNVEESALNQALDELWPYLRQY